MRYRESCLEAAAKEAELSDNLLNQLMPPHIHRAVRVGRPYGESCEVRGGGGVESYTYREIRVYCLVKSTSAD